MLRPLVLSQSNVEALQKLEFESSHLMSADAARHLYTLYIDGTLNDVLIKTGYIFDPRDIA
jgi:hypothetical protein